MMENQIHARTLLGFTNLGSGRKVCCWKGINVEEENISHFPFPDFYLVNRLASHENPVLVCHDTP